MLAPVGEGARPPAAGSPSPLVGDAAKPRGAGGSGQPAGGSSGRQGGADPDAEARALREFRESLAAKPHDALFRATYNARRARLFLLTVLPADLLNILDLDSLAEVDGSARGAAGKWGLRKAQDRCSMCILAVEARPSRTGSGALSRQPLTGARARNAPRGAGCGAPNNRGDAARRAGLVPALSG